MADLETIRRRAVEAANAAGAGLRLEDVTLDVGRDDDGDDFLRVIIEIKAKSSATEAEYERWLEAVELAVGEVDQRFPSVRFADAA